MSLNKEEAGVTKEEKVQDFLQLFNRYSNRIYGYTLSLTGKWDSADDLFQETVAVLWSKYEDFEPGSDFLAWALKIAYFKYLGSRKKKAIQGKHFSQATLERINEVAADPESGPSISLDALRECVAKLPERHKELLSLRYESSITIHEISNRVQLSVAALYKVFKKIHSLLFQCIRKQIESA